MNLSLSRSEFLAALGRVKPLANKFGLVQFTAGADGTLTLTTAGDTRHLQDRTQATVTEPGTASARAALLFDLVRLAEGADVTLRLEPMALVVECGRARHELALRAEAETFPPFPSLGGDATTFTLEDTALRALLEQTASAISTDPVRYILCGTSLRLANGTLEAAGCDGRRLLVASCPCPDPGETSFILPAGAGRELLRFLGTAAGEPAALHIGVREGQAQFRLGTLALATSLIEGSYPNYRAIIPTVHDALASLPRIDVVRALETISLVADAVTLEFSPSQLVLRSHGGRGTERLGEATETLLVAASQTAKGTYSVQLLRETLAAAPAESVTFAQSDNGTAVLRVAGGEANPTWIGVVADLSYGKPKA